MSDPSHQAPSESRTVADLLDGVVDEPDGEKDDDNVLVLRLEVRRADGVRYEKKAWWPLAIRRDELVHLAQKLLHHLEKR